MATLKSTNPKNIPLSDILQPLALVYVTGEYSSAFLNTNME